MAAQGAAAKLGFYLSKLNPVPGFPDYTGPYKVGTVDVEIPVSDLESPCPAPDNAVGIHTVQFRIFYPATPDSDGKRITWLPAPQRSHITAYTKFLGIGPILAEVVSFLPRHVHYTYIPVHKNATLLDPPAATDGDTDTAATWPTMIFSHGLGGNRNAYSHVVGSVASHGVVVICPEHRDGSSAVSFVRDPAAQDGFFRRGARGVIPYRRIPHTETDDVWDARDWQLRLRCWELGLIHEAVQNLQGGAPQTNLNASTPPARLAQLAGKLRVEAPGSIIWAGHSFGATNVYQFLKSTFHADHAALAGMPAPLFRPAPGSRIRAQVTERSPTILLDMWCFPLLSRPTRPLWRLPLPAYADAPSAPGGAALLAVESETFFKWTAHLHTTAKALSPAPAAPVVDAAAFAMPCGVRLPEPNVFYVAQAAHLNQSDFGLLFPWLMGKVFGAAEPERALRLNVRAILQMLRVNGVRVGRTRFGDLVDGAHADKLGLETGQAGGKEAGEGEAGVVDGIDDDKAIWSREGEGRVEAWHWVDIVGLGEEAGDKPKETKGEDAEVGEEAVDEEREMEGELEPHLSAEGAAKPVQAVVTAAAAAAAAAA